LNWVGNRTDKIGDRKLNKFMASKPRFPRFVMSLSPTDTNTPLHKQAGRVLQRARKLAIGADDLRQLSIELLWLEKKGRTPEIRNLAREILRTVRRARFIIRLIRDIRECREMRDDGPLSKEEKDRLNALVVEVASTVQAAASPAAVRGQARKIGTPLPPMRSARRKWAGARSARR
jgi:hypothetical protein